MLSVVRLSTEKRMALFSWIFQSVAVKRNKELLLWECLLDGDDFKSMFLQDNLEFVRLAKVEAALTV